MRHSIGVKLIAMVLVLLLPAGCQTVPEAAFVPEPLVSGQMVVVDRSSSAPSSVPPEKPTASDESALAPASGADSGESPPASVRDQEPSVAASASATAPISSAVPPASSTAPPASSAAQSEAPPSSAASSVSAPQSSEAVQASSREPQPVAVSAADEVRAVWISYLELSPMLLGRSESEFTASVTEMFDRCTDFGLNTAFVHVRPFGDALYDSDYFPWSYLATGEEGRNPGYDPLAIMVREGHRRGLRIEAWINPYRVRHDPKYALSSDNQAKIWLDQGSAHVASNGKGNIVFNPASEKAQELIVNGVREIIRKYDVDGIHIDDYFYPSTGTAFDTSFDASSYSAYKSAGGSLSHGDWRRGNVDTLVRKIYAAVKQENPRVLFGISPQSSVSNNYNAMYFDAKKALTSTGYCDYICPQIYFGFQNGTQPYAETLEAWDTMIKVPGVKLYTGLAAYKAGVEDSWAGAGKNEWKSSSNLLARQVQEARGTANYGGFAVYRYDSLFRPVSSVSAHIDKEAENLKDLL